MENVVRLLEQLGQYPLTHSTQIDFNALINESGVSAEIIEAIEKSDVAELNRLLDTRKKIVAFLVPAKEDDDESEESDDEDEEESIRVAVR